MVDAGVGPPLAPSQLNHQGTATVADIALAHSQAGPHVFTRTSTLIFKLCD